MRDRTGALVSLNVTKLLKVSHSRGTAWRPGWAPEGQVSWISWQQVYSTVYSRSMEAILASAVEGKKWRTLIRGMSDSLSFLLASIHRLEFRLFQSPFRCHC